MHKVSSSGKKEIMLHILLPFLLLVTCFLVASNCSSSTRFAWTLMVLLDREKAGMSPMAILVSAKESWILEIAMGVGC